MPVASLLLASLPGHYNAVLSVASSVGLLLVYQSELRPVLAALDLTLCNLSC